MISTSGDSDVLWRCFLSIFFAMFSVDGDLQVLSFGDGEFSLRKRSQRVAMAVSGNGDLRVLSFGDDDGDDNLVSGDLLSSASVDGDRGCELVWRSTGELVNGFDTMAMAMAIDAY